MIVQKGAPITKADQKISPNVRKEKLEMKKNLIGLLLLVMALASTVSWARTISLQWDPNYESELTGYKLYYSSTNALPFGGSGATEGSTPIDIGNATTATVNGLDETKDWYFAVTAYSASQESPYSNVVSMAAVSANYTITASAGLGGLISSSGATVVPAGSIRTYSFLPNIGYNIANVVVDGVSVGAPLLYTFSNVSNNHTISVFFANNAYSITTNADANGFITPSDAILSYGASQTFTITPNANYRVANVLVDGVSVGAPSSYGFSSVSANHTISVTFTNVLPVYRFLYLLKTPALLAGEHFYTITESEKTSIIANAAATWKYEFPAFYAYASSQPGTVPIYRFVNLQNGQHFYTATESEKAYIIANAAATWKYEFPTFYVPAQ